MQQFHDITQNNPKTTANFASIYELVATAEETLKIWNIHQINLIFN